MYVGGVPNVQPIDRATNHFSALAGLRSHQGAGFKPTQCVGSNAAKEWGSFAGLRCIFRSPLRGTGSEMYS